MVIRPITADRHYSNFKYLCFLYQCVSDIDTASHPDKHIFMVQTEKSNTQPLKSSVCLDEVAHVLEISHTELAFVMFAYVLVCVCIHV